MRWRDKIILFESKASQARLSCVLYFMRLILTYNTRCLDIPLFRPCVASPPAVSAKAILVSLHHCILDFKVKFLIEKASRVTYRGTLLWGPRLTFLRIWWKHSSIMLRWWRAHLLLKVLKGHTPTFNTLNALYTTLQSIINAKLFQQRISNPYHDHFQRIPCSLLCESLAKFLFTVAY